MWDPALVLVEFHKVPADPSLQPRPFWMGVLPSRLLTGFPQFRDTNQDANSMGVQVEIFEVKLTIKLKIMKSFLMMILVYGTSCLDVIVEMFSETLQGSF